jgi:hypothetical protein
MAAGAQVEALVSGAETAQPPYVPLLGDVVPRLAGTGAEVLAADPQAHARALIEVATALGADVITVGMLCEPALGADVLGRIEPLLAGRGVAACLAAPDPAAVRAYCEAGAQLLFLVDPDLSVPRPFKTVANVAGFYKVPVPLVGAPDGAARAAELGLQGAVVAAPSGAEPGIVGGGLDPSLPAGEPRPPRRERFFWSFPGAVPSDAVAEDLADLGRRLHP